MAISNADRQRAYRQRAAVALRGVKTGALPPATPSRNGPSLPTLMARMMVEHYRRNPDSDFDPNDPDTVNVGPESFTTETAKAAAAMLRELRFDLRDLLSPDPNTRTFVDTLGGHDYLLSAMTWDAAEREEEPKLTQDMELQAAWAFTSVGIGAAREVKSIIKNNLKHPKPLVDAVRKVIDAWTEALNEIP